MQHGCLLPACPLLVACFACLWCHAGALCCSFALPHCRHVLFSICPAGAAAARLQVAELKQTIEDISDGVHSARKPQRVRLHTWLLWKGACLCVTCAVIASFACNMI